MAALKKAKKKARTRKKAAAKKPAKAVNPGGSKLPQGFVEAQFKPGQSGNPNGRPKRRSMDEAIRHLLDQKFPDGNTRVDQVAAIVLDECIKKRDGRMLKELLARLWPITTRHEHANDPDAPLTDATPALDYSKLSIVELKALDGILSKASGE